MNVKSGMASGPSILIWQAAWSWSVSLWKYQRGWGPRKTHTQFCFSFLKTNSVWTLVSPHFCFHLHYDPYFLSIFPYLTQVSVSVQCCHCFSSLVRVRRDLKVFNKPTLFLLNLHHWLSCSCFSSSAYNRQPCPHCVEWSKVCKTKSFGRTGNNINTLWSCYWN